MATIFTVISNILTTIDFIRLFSDLGANNAQASITLEDIGRIVRAETATLFRDLEVSDLRNMHNSFYRVWLPSITARTTITTDDVNSSTGVLTSTFHQLLNAINVTKRSLDRLETIYRNNFRLFHIDDVVQGVFLFTEMYGLLFHMHSSYGTLRRISMGAATLEDPILLADTLTVRWYTSSAITIINWMRERAFDRRFDSSVFTPASHRWVVSGQFRLNQWYYEDWYQNLSDTPERNRINVPTPAAFHAETAWSETSAVVQKRAEDLRERRRQNLARRFSSRVTADYGQVVRRLEQFDVRMARREAIQRQGSKREVSSAASFIESKLANITPPTNLVISSNERPERDAGGEKETGLVLPVSLDEYRELSEFLRATTTLRESPAGEADTVDVCLHCNSVLRRPTVPAVDSDLSVA